MVMEGKVKTITGKTIDVKVADHLHPRRQPGRGQDRRRRARRARQGRRRREAAPRLVQGLSAAPRPMTPDWPRYATALPSIAAAVGRTPLVRLNRITADVRPAIYVKVEWYGATGSLKDRIYLHMYERAEARGDLRRGMSVLECSTGNAGIACAWVAAVKGYACTIVMPEGMSDERKKIMRAYGASLVFTAGGESDVDLALARLEEIRAADPDRYWVPGQFDNADNIEAHAHHGPGGVGADGRTDRRASSTPRAAAGH